MSTFYHAGKELSDSSIGGNRLVKNERLHGENMLSNFTGFAPDDASERRRLLPPRKLRCTSIRTQNTLRKRSCLILTGVIEYCPSSGMRYKARSGDASAATNGTLRSEGWRPAIQGSITIQRPSDADCRRNEPLTTNN